MTRQLTMEDLKPYQRTPKGLRYERYIEALKARLETPDSKTRAMIARENEGLAGTRTKSVTPSTVHQNATLSNVSIQYANDEYIGEQLMPAVTVGKQSNTYYIYDKRDRLAYPDDELGPRGSANELDENRSTGTYSCQGRGYKSFVDVETLMNQDEPLNEMVDLVESVAEGISFKRELRIAAIVGASGSYGSNTTAIAAASRWDTAGGGNPIKDIQDAVAACWPGRGPGKRVGFCSLNVWNVLSRHPALLELFVSKSGTAPGLATPDMVAPWFKLDQIIVGAARKDTANKGSAASYSRIWPDVFGIVRVAQRPSIRNASFGYTFRWGQVETDEWFDLTVGRKGGYYARCTTSEDHKIVAADTSFLITTPIG